MKQYETTIGLEVHVELSTEQKMFCTCSTQFGATPNTQCCPVCTGKSGAMPILNPQVVEYAVKAGLATNCQIITKTAFDRKHYSYPDLPKGYQITQFYEPICQDGYLDITTKKIRIREIHMEEDAGKLTYDQQTGEVQVDYNRCGIPLLELVTQPDFSNAQEVVAFLEQLKHIFQFIEVSDCKMEEGSLRVDVNLSVRPIEQEALGTRTEMKNLNSFKAVARAIETENKRQINLLEAGEPVLQETRHWEDATGTSEAMRLKENAADYNYTPDPDLPPVCVEESWISAVKKQLPELPNDRKQRYMDEFGLSAYDAVFLTATSKLGDLFEQVNTQCQSAKDVANWMMGEWMQLLNEKGCEIAQTEIDAAAFATVIQMVQQGVINRMVGKQVLKAVWLEAVDPAEYIKEHDLAMISDETILLPVIDAVLKDNPKSVQEYQNGKEKAFGFFMGLIMKETKGKANPEMVRNLLKERAKSYIILD